MTTGRKMKLSSTMRLALEAIALHGDRARRFLAIKPQTGDALWACGYLGVTVRGGGDTIVTARGYEELARAGSPLVSEAVARAAQAKAEAIVRESPELQEFAQRMGAPLPPKLVLIRGGLS